jgi:ketosteroid isomerase-like protein
MMKKRCISFCVLIFLSLSALPQKNEESLIISVLETQRYGWNKGDIVAYMQGYWQSDSLMFIGKSGVTYGWQQTLENYKKGYPDTAAMGKLNFEYIEIKRLSAIYYFVTGKWHLTRSIGNVGGHFTLLLRKIKGKWLIVKDHSS